MKLRRFAPLPLRSVLEDSMGEPESGKPSQSPPVAAPRLTEETSRDTGLLLVEALLNSTENDEEPA